MASCFEVEEEADEEDGRQENSPTELCKTLAALEAMPIHLNWGQILSLPDDMRQRMVIALKHPGLFAD